MRKTYLLIRLPKIRRKKVTEMCLKIHQETNKRKFSRKNR